jgi:glutathione synthase
MRKDPPVDAFYLRAARLLKRVGKPAWVCNRPASLIRWNEKLIILRFPRWIPPTLVSRSQRRIRRFARQAGGLVVLKSLTSFGGRGIAKADLSSPDFARRVREATAGGRKKIMVQAFLDAIRDGEKRIFLVDGEPLGALKRTPPPGGFLANPDLGARLDRTRLTPREKGLCAALAPFLRRHGIFFAGVDAIGEKLTEINITSPGMLWEWNAVDRTRHEKEIVDLFEKRLRQR